MASRQPAPGTVAVVTMMQRPAVVALYDGEFWRSSDDGMPVKCSPRAITSIETPYVFDPTTTAKHRAEPLGNRASGDGEISMAEHTHPMTAMLTWAVRGTPHMQAVRECPACDPLGYQPRHAAPEPPTDVGGPRVPPGT